MSELTDFFASNNRLLQETLLKAQARFKENFDRKRRGELKLEPSQNVWLSTSNLKLACPSKKLGPRFLGPFLIKRKINKVTFELELPESMRIHPVFHVSLLKPVTPDHFPDRLIGSPASVVINRSEEYEVESVLDCRRRGGVTKYLVKWRVYGPEENL